MSLVKINSAGPYQATKPEYDRGSYVWSVIRDDSVFVEAVSMAYRDDEVERVPAHLGDYNPLHWGEECSKIYSLWVVEARHRAKGEAR